MIAFAERLADAARAETVARWLSGCAPENKGTLEFDPVTEADREAERVMRLIIECELPLHGIDGEELPNRPAASRYSWSLDPVDGTRSFICGLPTWVTLIALLENDRSVLGVIDVPCLDERYVAYRGTSFFRSRGEERQLRTSDCKSLSEARLSTTDPYLFRGVEVEQFDRIRAHVRTTRYGHDGYAYARLAAGSIDLVVETGLKPHDYHALIPVVRAAGGAVGDWKGGEGFSEGRLIAAATPELYAETVALIGA